MKTFLYVLCITVFSIQPIFSQNYSNSAPKLIVYWPFDESSDSILIDLSDNGNTGFIHSGARVSGIKGQALSFNGTTDYAYVKNSASLNISNAITIECWVNARQIDPIKGSGQTFIRKEKAYVMGIGAGGRIGFYVCLEGGWTGSWTLSQQSILSSQWYHIAGVWNGKVMKVYINGIQDANTCTANGTVQPGDYDVYLGDFFESNIEKLNGVLDEVKVYNDTLSSDSIMAHCNSSRPRPPAILIPCLPNPTYNQRPVFSWYGNKSIQVFQLQIAANRQFSSPMVSTAIKDTTYTPSVNLPFGALFWRVGSEADTTWWSSVSSLYIQDTLIPILIPYTPDPTRIRKPLLTWRAVNNTKAYAIQIFSLPNSTTPFIADGVSDTFYLPAINLPAVTCVWRVKSDLSAAFSIADTFAIVSDSIPSLIPMAPDTQHTRRPTFLWNSANSAAYYILQIDTGGNFSYPFISTPVSDTSYSPSVDLPVGRIVWRVSASTNTIRFSAVDTFWVSANSLIWPANHLSGMKDNNVAFALLEHGIMLSFSIDKPSDISLIIFTMAGAKLAALHKWVTTPGVHHVYWNGMDGNETPLFSGSYIASFGIDNRMIAKRIMVLR